MVKTVQKDRFAMVAFELKEYCLDVLPSSVFRGSDVCFHSNENAASNAVSSLSPKDGIVRKNLMVEDRLSKTSFTNTDDVKITTMNELL